MREKIVRHLLPHQLRSQGEKIEIRLAAPEERLVLLRDKLIEEVEELVEAIDSGSATQVIGEMADVHAVYLALREHLGPGIVDEVSREKFFDRGSFTRCVVMKLDEPVPMILLCPKCGEKHVDKGIWGTTRIHRTHLCAKCGETWRPFPHATVGVEDVAAYDVVESNISGDAAPAVDVAEIQKWLTGQTEVLARAVKATTLACFDRLRKTVALNRGQSAEVLANSILAHLDQESAE